MRDRVEALILRTHPILVGFVGVLLILAIITLSLAFIEVTVSIIVISFLAVMSLVIGEWITDSVRSDRRYREIVNRRRDVTQD